jgi:predicted O-methyltransferase YrrM
VKLYGTREEILDKLTGKHQVPRNILSQARTIIGPRGKQEVYSYQAAALYCLAYKYNQREYTILEIGTYYGFTAAIMALAAPRAKIITLNPLAWEVDAARKSLRQFKNISVLLGKSWDYLEIYAGADLSMVFIDGDHKRVKKDLPWWNKIRAGGLFFFHDYSPLGAARHCPPVYEAVNDFAEYLGRDPDVLIVDNDKVGMAGFYKQIDDPDWEEI